jgi:hypothetical protein
MVEFVGCHVGVVQAVCRNDAAVSGRSVVDDGPDSGEIVLVAGAKGKLAHWILVKGRVMLHRLMACLIISPHVFLYVI